MLVHLTLFVACLLFLDVISCMHFGWEGLAVPCAIWLLAPQVRTNADD